MTRPSLRLGIVAGEASGDILGAAVLRGLAELGVEVEACGIGGNLMQELGCESWFDMERLSVMGLVDPLLRLPELLGIRRALRERFIAAGVDVFLGIDAPDFNLGLEYQLRRSGVATAHLVSPSVWAWRRGRMRKIERAVDLMLTLFPFEESIYRDHGVAVSCIGHPLADDIALEPDSLAARQALGIDAEGPVLLVVGVYLGDRRKGGTLLLDAIGRMRPRPLTILTLGAGSIQIDRPGVQVHPLGFVDHDRTKSLAYSAEIGRAHV